MCKNIDGKKCNEVINELMKKQKDKERKKDNV